MKQTITLFITLFFCSLSIAQIRLTIDGDATANRFLDANNTAFYTDPANLSILSQVNTNIIRDIGNTATFIDPSNTGTSINVAGQTIAARYAGNNTTYYLDPDNSGISLNALGQLIASRYTDANNQSFYADPASLSVLNEMNVNIIRDLGNTSRFIDPSNASTSINVAGQVIASRYAGLNTTYFLDPDNSGTSLNILGQAIATRYTDANNQSFYVDPASISFLSEVRTSIIRDLNNTSRFIDPSSTGTSINVSGQTIASRYTDLSSQSFFLDPANSGTALNINGTAIKPGGGDWSMPSDRRLKQAIEPFEDGLAEVLQINPVWFEYNGKAELPNEEKYVGIIAQEMQKIAPYTITPFEHKAKGKTEEYLSYNSTAVLYMLVNAIQEQQKQIEAASAENQVLKSELDAIRNELAQIKALLQANSSAQTEETKTINSESTLGQNIPNPFGQNTVIPYNIPSSAKQAYLQITDQAGVMLQKIEITTLGAGQLTLDAGQLNGSYFYSLIVDGVIIATKQLTIVK